jgi:Uncharacterized conserved small protein containing a coiled-coil domain
MSDNNDEDIQKPQDVTAQTISAVHSGEGITGSPANDAEAEDRLKVSLKQKLEKLLSEHRDLDDVLERLSSDTHFDQLQRQRLKKRKLSLKDEIIRLRGRILPDIIA